MALKRAAKRIPGVYERPKGSGLWSARYLSNGKWIRKSFGQDKAAAIAYVEKARTIARSGEGVLPTTARQHVLTFKELERKGTALTVADILDDYLKHVQKHPSQYKDQKNPPRTVAEIKAAFGEHSAATLQPHQIDDWLSEIAEERDLAPATVNRIKATFSGAYSRAVQRSRVATNPVKSVKQRRVSNGVIRFLTADEEQRLRAAIAKHAQDKAHLAQYQPALVEHRLCELTFALGTGARKGEQYGLRWADLDMAERRIVFRDTKNGESRIVEMIDDVHDALERVQALRLTRRKGRSLETPTDAVFAIGDNKKWWAQALKDAKIRDFRWHDLRHSFCSRLAQAGVNLKVIQEAAGHKTIQMTSRYAHLDRTTMRGAMAVLNRVA